MKRTQFLVSSLSAAAALTVPEVSGWLPRAWARESGATTTVTWWNWGDPAINPGVAAAPNQHNSSNDAIKVYYQQSHPGTILDSTTYNYPDYVTALKTAFAGGSPPDTVELEPGPLITQYQPFLLPLDSYAARSWGANWRDQFLPLGIAQTLAADPQHKTMYGLPIGLECGNGLFYNAAIFAQYNLQTPRTYAELKHVADVLNGHGVVPISWGAKDGWPNFDWLRMLVEQTAPGVWDQALLGKAKFTDPGIVHALQILVQMQKDRIFSTSCWGTTAYPEAITLFMSGKAAMYLSGTWDISGYSAPTTKIRQQVEVMPLPVMAPGLKRGHLWAATNLIAGVSKTTPHPQAAFDFIAWQADQGQQLTWVNKTGFLPSRKGLTTAPQPDEHFRKVAAYFQQELPHAVIRYGATLTAALQKAIEDAIANASTLGMDPAKALSAVQTVADSKR